ncbi:MAG: mechanosensitive ion channel family protein [Cytophagales bacterium]|nr:mechanosensitive ion channel family protein [Cytophagales bacterium]
MNIRLIFFLLLVLPLASPAQVTKADSTVDQAAQLVQMMDSVRRSDSVRRMELHQEIDRLKGSANNSQREALVQQLRRVEREDSLRNQRRLQQLQDLKVSGQGFAVTPFKDTLFLVYTRIGSFSANERAKAITAKIITLYKDYDVDPDSLAVNVLESSAEITYKDITLMSVNELEAMWFEKTPEEVAKGYRDIIKTAIVEERSSNSILNLILRIAAIIVILVGIYVIILFINKLFKNLNGRVSKLKDTVLKGIRFRGYQFLDSDRELQVILFLMNIFRLFMIALALYIALPLLFSVFPWTRGIADTLIGWVTSPLKRVVGSFIKYLPNLFTILVIGAVTYYVVQFLKFVAAEIERGALSLPGFYPDWSKPTLNIVKFLLYAFSFIIIFPYLPGSDSPIFQGVSVFVGVLFSLGSSTAISNAIAGLVITYMRPFKIGDRIKIGDLTGDVLEKSLLVTRIRTIKNEEITIPNATILGGHTTNYTTSAKGVGLILYTSVTIGYDVPWKQVHELLISAALVTKGILSDTRKPFVLQTSLDDFYVSYQLNAYTEESHRMAGIYSDLHQNIQDKFNESGVEILSPHYRAARDGNMTTVPANYLPPGYQSPTFKVTVENQSTDKKS